MNEQSVKKALQELRKEKERKFEQTVDLIINLRSFNIKKDSINIFVELPHRVKEKKICALLEKKSGVVDTITAAEFAKYKDEDIKRTAKEYDSFISVVKLMPAVAKTFGKVLGPLGKMPSPKLGIILKEDEKLIQDLIIKINKNVRVITKEPSLKIPIGRQSMKDEEIIENVLAVYKKVFDELPRKKENLKSVLIKFTMSKPVKIDTK